jgi:hypothetical protein
MFCYLCGLRCCQYLERIASSLRMIDESVGWLWKEAVSRHWRKIIKKISGQLMSRQRFELRTSRIHVMPFGSVLTVVCSRQHKWLSSSRLLKNNSNHITVNEPHTLRRFELVFQLTSSISWDITPCSPLKLSRRFGGTCRLYLQARRISQASR